MQTSAIVRIKSMDEIGESQSLHRLALCSHLFLMNIEREKGGRDMESAFWDTCDYVVSQLENI